MKKSELIFFLAVCFGFIISIVNWFTPIYDWQQFLFGLGMILSIGVLLMTFNLILKSRKITSQEASKN